MSATRSSTELPRVGWFSDLIAQFTGKQTETITAKEEVKMVKVLVLYHSMYGHIETMAQSVAEGARSVPGVEVTVKRVPETMDAEAFKAAHGKEGQTAAVA